MLPTNDLLLIYLAELKSYQIITTLSYIWHPSTNYTTSLKLNVLVLLEIKVLLRLLVGSDL